MGAPAIDAISTSTYKTASASYSWSHTCSGTDRYLFVGVSMLSIAGSSVSAITYNGVALTKLGSVASATGAVRAELWGLANPAEGANTVAVTLSAALDSIGNALSYIGAAQSSSTEGGASATATNVGAADATVNVTTTSTNRVCVDVCATDDTAITIGTGNTSRENVTGTLGSGAMGERIVAIASTVALTWTNVAGLATWSIYAIALKPQPVTNWTGTDNNINSAVSFDNGVPTTGKDTVFDSGTWTNDPSDAGSPSWSTHDLTLTGDTNFSFLGAVPVTGDLFTDLGGNSGAAGAVTGDAQINNVQNFTLASLGANLTGSGNIGEIDINLLTGSSEQTIDNDAPAINLVNIASKQVLIGPTVQPLNALALQAGTTSGRVRFNHASTGIGVSAIGAAFHSEIQGDAAAGDVAIPLGSATIASDVTLSAVNTSVHSVTISNFTQLRASGQQAKYATVTGGVEGNRARGSSYVVNYSAAFSAFAFTPDRVIIGSSTFQPSGGDYPMTLDTTAKTCTLTIPTDFALGSAAIILDRNSSDFINLDTITVVLPSKPKPSLSLGLGLGL